MTKKTPQTISPFLKIATELDADITELRRLAQILESSKVDSDKALNRSQIFLTQFNEVRTRIGVEMTVLGRTLESVRDQIEADTATAITLAGKAKKRHDEAAGLLEEFKVLGQKVGVLTQSAAELKATFNESSKESHSSSASKSLHEMISDLDTLIMEANSLKEKANKANMRALESSADSLKQKLQSTNQRLSLLTKNTPAETLH